MSYSRRTESIHSLAPGTIATRIPVSARSAKSFISNGKWGVSVTGKSTLNTMVEPSNRLW
jgi:hypothetical protein